MSKTRLLQIACGPLGYFLAVMLSFSEDVMINRMLGVMIWMALWWSMEVVPLGVTALLPFILYPLLGIMDAKTVAPIYSHHVIFLFLGGFLIAFALEKWGLHKRIALKIIRTLGYSPKKILLGFMVSSFLLSMWISNTATTLMLIAPALAVIKDVGKILGKHGEKKFSIGLLLGVAYSASVGGAATYVGTPANIAFLNFYEGTFPGQAPGFVTWMVFAFPVALIVLVCMYLFLSWRYCGRINQIKIENTKAIDEKKPWSYEEKVVAMTFISIALLWLTRGDIHFGNFTFEGWGGLFKDVNGKEMVQDSTVAVVFAFLLFLIPTANNQSSILTAKEFKKIPYNILLLFGGGFALSKGVGSTGLGEFLAKSIVSGNDYAPWVFLLVLVLFVVSLTELSSNTATIMLLLPIMLAVSIELELNPLYLMIPTTLASSFAFMFPIATPPNTIIFESEKIPSREMLRTGVWINLVAVLILFLLSLTWGKIVFAY